MVLPLAVLPALRPPSIGTAANGLLANDSLVNVRLHENYDLFLAIETAITYQRLAADCLITTGVILGISGGGAYRTLNQQINLFFQRYETPPVPGRPTRTYLGRTYSLKAGMASAATPGTSNHGFGAAVDLEVIADKGPPRGVYGSGAWEWLLANAIPYGLSWELQDEPWHLRLVAIVPNPKPLPAKGRHDMGHCQDKLTKKFWYFGRDGNGSPWASPIDELPGGGEWDVFGPINDAVNGPLVEVDHAILQRMYDRRGRPGVIAGPKGDPGKPGPPGEPGEPGPPGMGTPLEDLRITEVDS